MRLIGLRNDNLDLCLRGRKSLAMPASDLIDPIPAAGGSLHLARADSWMQGRTLYGGASTLIAYTAAIRAFPDLPPLRAAQVGFVGPVGADMELKREIIRQGKNVTQLRSEIWCNGNCALTAFFLFGTTRDANAVHPPALVENWPLSPEEAESLATDRAPEFLQANYELRRAQDERGPGNPVVRRWARLTTREGLDSISELILLGDLLPPGAMRAMQRQGPFSSINWSFNLLDTEPQTNNGWWLTENASQHADEGYSSERLRMWNSEGRQVLDGFQCVAIFG